MRDRGDPHARERALLVAREDPPAERSNLYAKLQRRFDCRNVTSTLQFCDASRSPGCGVGPLAVGQPGVHARLSSVRTDGARAEQRLRCDRPDRGIVCGRPAEVAGARKSAYCGARVDVHDRG